MPSQTYSTAGTYSFSTTAGVIYTIESWGAGGGGAGRSSTGSAPHDRKSAPGGGGGGYSKLNSFVGTGGNISVVVGAGGTGGAAGDNNGTAGGDSTFNGTSCVAKGGGGGLTGSPYTGTGAVAGTGDVTYTGGNGGDGGNNDCGGGGGGSSAGTGSNGANGGSGTLATGSAGGTAPTGGGDGGHGGEEVANGGLTNGSAPGGGGGGASHTDFSGTSYAGANGADGKVVITWTDSTPPATAINDAITLYTSGKTAINNAITLHTLCSAIVKNTTLFIAGPTTLTSGISLFIGQQCYDGLYPSGDIGYTPSGRIINSNGTITNLYSYINSDPLNSLTDNSYIRVMQSGQQTHPQNLYFSNYNLNNDQYNVLKLAVSNSGVTSLETSGILHGKLAVDNVHSYYYYAYGNNIARKRTDFTSDSSTFISSINAIVNIKKICISYFTQYVYVLGQLISDNLYYIYRYDFAGNYIDTVYSFPSNRVGISMRYNEILNKLVLLYSTVVGSSTLYYNKCISLSDAGGYSSEDSSSYLGTTQLTDFELRSGQNKLIYSSNTQLLDYSGICSPTLVGTLATVDSNANISSIAIDESNSRIYAGYFDTVKSSGVIRSYNVNNGGGASVAYAASGYYIGDLALDNKVYRQVIDFELENPGSTMTDHSSTQLVSNAEVVVKGLENYNLSYVNAKILTQNRQNIIWSPDGPYSASFSGTTDGLKIGYIGFGNSSIDQSYNARSDWNNAILRLEIAQPQKVQPSGDFYLYAAKVNIYCSGDYPDPYSIYNSCTLHTQSKIAYSGSITLCIRASGKADTIPLYTLGAIDSVGTSTLFTIGNSDINSGIPLYISGRNFSYANMNMFLKVNTPIAATNNMPFFIYSSATPASFKVLPLYLKAYETSDEPYTTMNLYMGGTGAFGATSYMNLFLKSEIPISSKGTTLFIQNNTLAYNSGIPLFMYGPQNGGSGWYPTHTNMNLYIARATESVANARSLYISGPSGINKSTTLFVQGAASRSGIPLYIRGYDNPNNSISLYSHGF